MEKLFKLAEGDELCAFLYGQFTRARLGNYSAMGRLGNDFSGVTQHLGKLRIHLELKGAREREQGQDLYKWEFPTSDKEYEAFRKGEGLILRLWLEQLIDTFSNTSSILTLKITNFAEWRS
jgi:hypothetical protein